jgi:hypothetical protein
VIKSPLKLLLKDPTKWTSCINTVFFRVLNGAFAGVPMLLADTSLDICQSITDYTVVIKERWLKDGGKKLIKQRLRKMGVKKGSDEK